jgi:hypothetical protein
MQLAQRPRASTRSIHTRDEEAKVRCVVPRGRRHYPRSYGQVGFRIRLKRRWRRDGGICKGAAGRKGAGPDERCEGVFRFKSPNFFWNLMQPKVNGSRLVAAARTWLRIHYIVCPKKCTFPTFLTPNLQRTYPTMIRLGHNAALLPHAYVSLVRLKSRAECCAPLPIFGTRKRCK